MITISDVRRCPAHGTVISSPDGMFDGLCGACEAEYWDAHDDLFENGLPWVPDDPFGDMWRDEDETRLAKDSQGSPVF